MRNGYVSTRSYNVTKGCSAVTGPATHECVARAMEIMEERCRASQVEVDAEDDVDGRLSLCGIVPTGDSSAESRLNLQVLASLIIHQDLVPSKSGSSLSFLYHHGKEVPEREPSLPV